MKVEDLLRPDLRDLEPYTCARHQGDSGRLLDANENPYPSPLDLLEAEELGRCNRYPDPECRRLKAALSEYLGQPAERIFTGSGSDEAIDLLIRALVTPGEAIAVLDPTYSMYGVRARIQGASVLSIPLGERFQPEPQAVDRTLSRAGVRTKLVFVCSPNNPTGNLLEPERLEAIAGCLEGLLVVDEAYVEFADRPSFLARAARLPNVVVLRTFSKAWGLAGLRVGYAVADPALIRALDRIRFPYNVGVLAETLAVRALQHRPLVEERIRTILEERDRLASALEPLVDEVYPSDANFLLVRVAGASGIQRRLAQEEKILIRDRSTLPGLSDALRITVGTPEENDAVLAAIRKARSS